MFQWLSKIVNKENPAQERIVLDEGDSHYSYAPITTISQAYDKIEVVNRGVNLIVDSASEINIDIKARINGLAVTSADIRPDKLNSLLNFKPNLYQDISSFRRKIYMDLITEGNAFIHFDGAYLYNLPAINVEIVADKRTYIKEFKYDDVKFRPDEIIWIKENSVNSIYRGKSRVLSTLDSVNALNNLISYQSSFLEKGTVPGIVLTSQTPLSDKVKDRIRAKWSKQYNLKNNSKQPIVLDGGFDLKFLGATTIKELDFESSIDTLENKILEAIGVPQVLLKSGNNANIRPNISLFYLLTVLPIVTRVTFAFERFFGYDLKCVTTEIEAMRPELRDQANYLSTLSNSGIMKRNEARDQIRLPASDEDFADKLILPANIAGSAVDSTQGGRPAGQ